jgi:repressor LexA
LAEEGKGSVVIPLLGTVAAGKPIEAIEHRNSIEVPKEMLGTGEYFGLKVEGFSMVEDGILDKDIIIVKKQETAFNGQTVVALVNGNATVKKFYLKENCVELRPANPAMSSLFITNGDFRIQGIFVGLIRTNN